MIKIGIIGNGFVGKATKILKCKDIDLLVYDIIPELCEPKGLTINDLSVCDLIFISVPTPMNNDGTCYLGIVESVVKELFKVINKNKTQIVIRSTVVPGTCDNLNTYFMPEFLTEKNFQNDFINCKEWIFGMLGKNKKDDDLFINNITKLFNLAKENNCIKYNNLFFVKNKEAEMIKYVKNCYLSVKVSFFNEIHEFCEKSGINYENVRKLATMDNRIMPSHSYVPGPDGKKGFGGTCFPKDTSALKNEMDKIGMKSFILDSAIKRNDMVDRPDKDWAKDKGRSHV